MADLLVRRSGSRALGPYRLVRRGSRALGGSGLVSAGSGASAAAGGEALLGLEANGFAVDFLYPTDAKRVAVKETLGPELVTNGGFDSGTGWTLGAGWTISGGQLVGTTVAAFVAASQTLVLTASSAYRVTFTVTVAAGGLNVYLGSNGDSVAELTPAPSTSVQGALSYSKTFVSGTQQICFRAGGSGFTGTIDIVSIKEVAAVGATTTTEYAVDAFFANAGTSPKQVYYPSGALDWCPHNFLLRSQEFDNASWTKSGATIGANVTTAPDTTSTADAFIPNNGSVAAFMNQSVTSVALTAYTVSAYVKNGTLGTDWCQLMLVSTSTWRAWFNLATGAKGTSSGTPQSYNITDVGGGWYRVDMSVIPGTVTANCYLIANSADGSTGNVTGDGSSPAFYAWGAQLQRGSAVLAYLPTTSAARIGLAIDHDPATTPVALRGLLCEPAATNLLLRSGEFDHASWGKTNSTVTANATAAPDGTLTADAFIPGVAASVQYLQQNVTTVAATAYTFSVYVKNGALGNNWIDLTISSTTTWRVWFNLATGAKGTSLASPTSYNITSVGSGWYRLDVTVTAGTTTTQCFMLARSSDGSTSFVTGDAVTPAFYAWGAQLETGTVATSPIPTFAASATRAQDVYNVTPASINYSATAGSWWVENYQTAFVGSGPRIIGFSGSISPLYFSSASAVSLFDTGVLTKATTTLSGSVRRWASAFASGDRAITVDGLTVAADAGGTATLLNPGVTLQFGNGATSNPMFGYIRKVYYLPRRMSNVELVTETT